MTEADSRQGTLDTSHAEDLTEAPSKSEHPFVVAPTGNLIEFGPPQGPTIFVGDVPTDVTKRDLLETFKKYGRLGKISIIRNSEGICRGYAFVEFERVEDFKIIVEKGYDYVNGKRVQIKLETETAKKDYIQGIQLPPLDTISSKPPTSGSSSSTLYEDRQSPYDRKERLWRDDDVGRLPPSTRDGPISIREGSLHVREGPYRRDRSPFPSRSPLPKSRLRDYSPSDSRSRRYPGGTPYHDDSYYDDDRALRYAGPPLLHPSGVSPHDHYRRYPSAMEDEHARDSDYRRYKNESVERGRRHPPSGEPIPYYDRMRDYTVMAGPPVHYSVGQRRPSIPPTSLPPPPPHHAQAPMSREDNYYERRGKYDVLPPSHAVPLDTYSKRESMGPISLSSVPGRHVPAPSSAPAQSSYRRTHPTDRSLSPPHAPLRRDPSDRREYSEMHSNIVDRTMPRRDYSESARYRDRRNAPPVAAPSGNRYNNSNDRRESHPIDRAPQETPLESTTSSWSQSS